MRDVWLNPNRRALFCGLIPPGCLLAFGLLLVWGIPDTAPAFGWIGWGMIVVAALASGIVTFLLRQPRLAREGDWLLVYLGPSAPIRVPLEVVECFFLGQGPSLIPRPGEKQHETATVVVRLAEAAQEWQHRDVKPALGHWCDSYITIRGTWCEPLNAAVVKRLNDRLVQFQRERKEQGIKEPASKERT